MNKPRDDGESLPTVKVPTIMKARHHIKSADTMMRNPAVKKIQKTTAPLAISDSVTTDFQEFLDMADRGLDSTDNNKTEGYKRFW